ncbi:unnamed protein product (macronuclear) [Paramecium tetraurelia]|uniref:EF-hand domain-containing protein n=1 Tax=Paramecium tetraurelia TaxID=5888 RepID=A0BYN6_PARTE|nr:uncharacterized protein GSPATT00033506001 [Paramecium tetraurelia]CAK63653.1 unnamed protein product [Paramecium tetraurelia]|eukprot:XP_001431051.1 hypothetical protein (macronuclear) [Paramecium tetraurelia strain d4-2]
MSDNQLTDLLLYYAYVEQEIEILREVLCSEPYFQPYNLFKFIDCLKDEPKGYLTAQDLSYYLSDIQFLSNLRTKTYIENYNQNQDGKLVYSEFLRTILPISNPDLREKITQQTPSESIIISERTQYLFAKLMEAEIKLTIQAENYKQQIDPNFFDKICYQNYIYHQDLQSYFKHKYISTNSAEIQQIFNRIDLLNDGKIDRNEWNLWVSARKSVLSINSNSYKQQQKFNNTRYSSTKRKQQDSTMSDLFAISKQGFYQSTKPPLTNFSYNTPKKYQKQKTDLRAQMHYSLLQNSNSKQEQSYKTIPHKQITRFYDDDIQTLKKSQSAAKFEALEPVNYYVQLFLNLIQLVKKIERQKILLSNHDDFSLYSSFQKLDKGFKGILIKSDLNSFCKYPQLILDRYGKDNKIRFSEYIKMVEPKDPQAVEILLQKDQKQKGNMLTQTELSLRLLFQLIEEFQQKINQTKDYQSKQQFDISEIFYMLAYDRQYITNQDITDFLQANQFSTASQDVDLLIYELDFDSDGYISYRDFVKIFGK